MGCMAHILVLSMAFWIVSSLLRVEGTAALWMLLPYINLALMEVQ